ncbi:MAG: hypothetical protein V2I67_11305 [Thermoanaerobaculales bacterium]|jgi:hypothetical protein|nr:hypothetical protein [Thermoanaerobaculales bacterium]
MRRSALLVAIATVAWFSTTPAAATTVGGSLTYGGLPLTSTFSGMQSGVLQVRSLDQNETTNYVIDFGDSYQVPVDLPAGQYRFWIMFTLRAGQTGFTYRSGDLYRSVGLVHVPNQTTFTLDVEMLYLPRVTQPLDSTETWPGYGCTGCPIGAVQPVEFTIEWAPVPLATSYGVEVRHMSCAGALQTSRLSTNESTIDICQLQIPGEEYIDVSILAYDNRNELLSANPLVLYAEDGCGRNAFSFNAGGPGRVAHNPGRIVPQVARVQGVGASFWTSDLILTNPTARDLTTTLYYTPREADGLSDYIETEVEVPAGACRVFNDVVHELFGTTGAGSLEVASSSLVVASRISTPAAGGGAYGQGLSPITSDQVLSSVGDRAVGGGVMKAPGARSNLALNEVWGEQAAALVILKNRDGVVLGTRRVVLAPFSNHQINDLASRLGGVTSLSEGQVEVRHDAGAGRIAATLVLVDSSDDPSTVPLYEQP